MQTFNLTFYSTALLLTVLMILCLFSVQMAEFETIPELTRVLTASHAGISAGSKTLLQITDKLHFEAQIPLVYMGRYAIVPI